jgi:hypothetical protein
MADDALSRLTQDEKTALAALLKRTIADDRYPLSPRIGVLRGILAKLQPPKSGAGTATTAEGVCPASRLGKAAQGSRMIKCARTVCKKRSADPKADGWTWIALT